LTRFEVHGVVGADLVKMEFFAFYTKAKRKIPDFATAMKLRLLVLDTEYPLTYNRHIVP